MRKLNDNLRGFATSVLLLLASSCGGGHNAALHAPAPGPGVDSQLMSALSQELAATGRDISSTTPAAPSGAANAVVDLQARFGSQAAGLGAGPGGVKLVWTEQLAGDYDQNGQVGLSDLKPLGQYFHHTVSYSVAARPGGYPAQPAGNPGDTGPGGAFNNWRLARVDGDSNGEIGLSDIKAIAQHWGESLSGYTVYRRAAGETAFTPLPGAAAGQPTVVRPATLDSGPVAYSFDAAAAAGACEYYVRPVDLASGQQGQPSPVLAVDAAAGTANLEPFGALDANLKHASAGQPVTLDASASVDFDGAISAVRWDLDGDGVVDYATDGATATTSSTGLVTQLTPGSGNLPLTLTATFTTPSGQAYTPRVQVVDDHGAASPWVGQVLSVSGWQPQLVSTTGSEVCPGGELAFEITDLRLDPVTGEVVAVGVNPGPEVPAVVGHDSGGRPIFSFSSGNVYDPAAAKGVFLARRNASGQWTTEKVADVLDPAIQAFGALPRDARLAWETDGRPLVVIGLRLQPDSISQSGIFVAHRQSSGDYQLAQIFDGTAGQGGSLNDFYPRGPGQFAAKVLDPRGSGGYDEDLLTYDNGAVSVEQTGCNYLAPDNWTSLAAVGFTAAGGTLLGTYTLSTETSLPYRQRVGPGTYTDLTFSRPGDILGYNMVLQRIGELNGQTTLLLDDLSPSSITDYVVQNGPNGMHTIWSHQEAMAYSDYPLSSFQPGAISVVDSVAYANGSLNRGGDQTELDCHRIEGGASYDEPVYQLEAGSDENATLGQLADDANGHLACVLRPRAGHYGAALTQIVVTRVGPPAS